MDWVSRSKDNQEGEEEEVKESEWCDVEDDSEWIDVESGGED